MLNATSIEILPGLSIRIPTVGEVLNNETAYYSIVSALTASPFDYMVPLDDMGMDFTQVTDYELFLLLFPMCAKSDLSILFGDFDASGFQAYQEKGSQRKFLYSPGSQMTIDEPAYQSLADALRKMNLLEKNAARPGNASAKKYLLERERKKLRRSAKKAQGQNLESLVVALVNTSEFPYNYDSCMDLSIYRFNLSVRQIQKKIAFDNTMIGIYAGSVDTSKLTDKDALSWI